MPTIGLPELLIIGILLLLVFGGSRLPSLGEGAGRAIGKLLRATKNNDRIEIRDGKQDPAISDAEVIARPRSDHEEKPPQE